MLDLIFDSIEPSLKAFADDRGVVVSVDGIGSLSLERLRSDEIDLAIIAFPENEPVLAKSLVFSLLRIMQLSSPLTPAIRSKRLVSASLVESMARMKSLTLTLGGILASCCGAVEISSQFQVWPAIVSPSSSSATPYSRGR